MERLFVKTKNNGVSVAAATNISASQIYKWTRGEQIHISKEDLTKISKVICKNKFDAASLVFAHVMDERYGPHHTLVRVEIDDFGGKDGPKNMTQGERALQYLAESRLSNPEVNDFIISYVKCIGAKL